MNLSIKDIDALLVSLTSRGFLDYESENGKVITSLKPTYNKIIVSFQNELVRIVQGNKNKEVKEELSNIYLIMQNELGRNLSPLEIEKVREWISQGIEENVIIDSLHECMAKNKRVTIRSIDKIIIKRLSSKDLKEEGYSAVNEKWKKELEDTIDIANTKWTDEE
jgi:DNA replication protein